ncbi:hypothetical protein ACX0G9_31435, partial [Flavitalea flava]
LCLIFRIKESLVAFLSGLMIFLWVFMLHIPRAVGMPKDHGELTAVFEALAFSGILFILAAIRKK